MPYSRVQFTSPQRGEVGLRSKPGEGALHLTIDRNPSPQPSPNGRGSALPLPLHLTILKKGGSGESGCRYIWSAPKSLHRTFVGEAILAALDDGGDGFQRELTVGVLHHVLQIEILDRDVVVAELERAAHRLEIGFLHRRLHLVLLAGFALHRHHP